MPRPRLALLLAAATLTRTVALAAQTDAGTPREVGRTFQLPSRVLGETRTIDVTLPPDYTRSGGRRYPVLFVLDGEFEGGIASTTATFLASVGQLPPTIVVDVRNVDRTRDDTPPPTAGFQRPPEAATAGGAGRFLGFLAEELIPWVEGRYRTAPMRVLVGHSLGGLFAFYAMAERPELFLGYLVMEPSVWWNDHHELKQAIAALRRPAAARERVVTVNAETLGLDTTKWGGDAPMIRELEVKGETHQSMALAGMMKGLRAMFADFLPTDWRPGTHPIAMLDRYDSLAARIGYPEPIPEAAFTKVIRMSIDGRYFDDAARALERLERTLGPSTESREFRDRLARERAAPAPAGWVPLEIPSHRPTPKEAAAFLGRWQEIGADRPHEIEVRASGDTIVVHDRIPFPNGDRFEQDDPVVQITADGVLEWGLPWFRELPALLVLQGRLGTDGVLTVTRESRGWVPRGPGADLHRTERFRRVAP